MLRIAIAQINPTVGDIQGNQQKITHAIEAARKKQVDVVAFPEMTTCGYPPEDLLYKEYFVADNLSALRSISKKTKGIAAIVGFVDRDKAGNVYNAAAVLADGRIIGKYRKEELPNYGVFDEKRYFSSGRNNPVFSCKGVSIGVNICEDIWVNDAVYKQQVYAGTKIIINLSSSPYVVGKIQERERMLKRRAKETKNYIFYVNLVGGQDELVFDGSSCIVDPKGNIISEGKCFEEDVIYADIDVKKLKKKGKPRKISVIPCSALESKKEIPVRLKTVLSKVEEMYKALVLGTKDYVQKNGFQKVVIGLSGGIDSALVAAIAVAAVGKENVIGVTMPSQYTSKGTKSDAVKLAKNLEIKLIEIPIKGVFSSYLKALKREFEGTKLGVAEENVQARIRGNFLMALSNKFGWLVLTTGNKSEFAVGYCTLYGDMSGGFAVLKDILKTKVYDLSRFINAQKKIIIPPSIIKRAPSAELRENQKDQDSLPPYNVLDKMLEQYVENHKSILAKGTSKELAVARKVVSLIDRSEYKRRQSPPGIKITRRSFGKDWRLPVTNKYKEHV